jgi:SAM-dependent methyltransferase
VDRVEYKRTSLENWDTMAPGWERMRERLERFTSSVSEWMVEALDPQPGDVVLELAAGPGDTGFIVAARLGDEGRLISSDFSSEMVDVARRRAAQLGLKNVAHSVIDAEEIPLEDDTVDGVLCRFGFMLMPDPEAAIGEVHRVLRPGGGLVLAVWSTAERNPWVTIAGRILAELGLVPLPEPDAPGPFLLADSERLRGLLEGGGFDAERIEEVPVLITYDDVDDFIAVSSQTSGMLSKIWRDASSEELETIVSRLAEGFAPFAVDGGYAFPGVAVVASARAA